MKTVVNMEMGSNFNIFLTKISQFVFLLFHDVEKLWGLSDHDMFNEYSETLKWYLKILKAISKDYVQLYM